MPTKKKKMPVVRKKVVPKTRKKTVKAKSAAPPKAKRKKPKAKLPTPRAKAHKKKPDSPEVVRAKAKALLERLTKPKKGETKKKVIPIVDVSQDQRERDKALNEQIDMLFAGAMKAAAEEDVEPERVEMVKMMYTALKAGIAMREAQHDHERMMHAARVLHGWTTLEQIEARIAAANAGDEEAVREICEIVELVKSGSDVPDAS